MITNLRNFLRFAHKRWLKLSLNGVNTGKINEARFGQLIAHYDREVSIVKVGKKFYLKKDTRLCSHCRIPVLLKDKMCRKCGSQRITCQCPKKCRTGFINDDWIKVEVGGKVLKYHSKHLYATDNNKELFEWPDGVYRYYSRPILDSIGIPIHGTAIRPWLGRDFEKQVYGVELEIWAAKAKETYSALPKGFAGERDGSIDRCHGLEIIGPPLTFNQYLQRCPWKGILKLIPTGHKANAKYGMHVNVNREGMTSKGEDGFVDFITTNTGFCQIVAERPDNQENHSYSQEYTDDKHCAVNQLNDERLEVRIFKTVDDWPRFMKNIKFCVALQEFTKTGGLSLDKFLKLVSRNRKKYKHLFKFISQPLKDIVCAS